MSDFIYCPICDRRTSIDEASYFEMIPLERQSAFKIAKPSLSDGDMVCMDCEINGEEN